MKCLYCSSECTLTGDNHWQCDQHPVMIMYYHYATTDKSQTTPDYLVFLHTYRGKRYGIWLFFENETRNHVRTDPYFKKPYFEIMYYPSDQAVPAELLLHLNRLPNINPDNVAQKLPIYLTFL